MLWNNQYKQDELDLIMTAISTRTMLETFSFGYNQLTKHQLHLLS